MSSMDNTAPTAASAVEPKIELTVNTRTTKNDVKNPPECTCSAGKPRLIREASIDSINSADSDYRRPFRQRPRRRVYSISPARNNSRNRATLLASSAQLLDKVNTYDGIADVPYPARGSIYLTTYPFTDKDVKKYAWLFSLAIEDTFLVESTRGRLAADDSEDDATPHVRPVRRGRDRSPFYEPSTVDVPSAYLSRALDTDVVSAGTEDAKYLIVTQNRHRPGGTKLLIAESRQAAGMLMYYELLKGDSVLFVGAVVGEWKKGVHPKKFMRVDSADEAAKVGNEGLVGVIC